MDKIAELDPEALPVMVQGYRLSQALYVVAALKIPDLLQRGGMIAAELAAATGTHPDRLRRVMRALAAEGVFEEDGRGAFSQTRFSAQLVGDSEARLMIMGWRMLPEAYGAFGALLQAVKTGETAFDHVYALPFYRYLASHPRAAAVYQAAMESTVEAFGEICDAYDFSAARTIVDVGGGQGAFLGCLLSRHPDMRGILLDDPDVVAGSRRRLEAEGIADRVTIVGGDIFLEIPAGADAYFTCTVLRCFDDYDCVRILKNIRTAMSRDARLVAVEQEVPSGRAQRPTALLDSHSMVVYGGRDRTATEYGRLFAEAGLELVGVTPVGGPMSAFEGRLSR
ncbi:MAG: acetylserotonin O-methyltransferase [Candidatus Dormibacteraeota bacterium]|nr:acetylserotonin O-methyltransferase [Candidatus Dormibacteraeota bacterium]